MTSNPNQPDRAHDGDFDAAEVPTVRGSDIYAKAGRVAPQTIPPAEPSPVVEPTAPAEQPAAPAGAEAETTIIPAQDAPATPAQPAPAPSARERALASDAPTEILDTRTPSQQRADDVAAMLPPLSDVPAPAGAAPHPTPQAAAYEPAADYAPVPNAVEDGTSTTVMGAVPQPGPAEDNAIADDVVEELALDPRRGTIDFGLLLLRLAVGSLLGFHALSIFFGMFGSAGLSALRNEFSTYTYPSALAIIVPALELAAAVFLILGLVAPVAAAVATVATGFLLIHQIVGEGSADGILLAGLLFALSLVLQFTGPGRLGLDFSRSWARRPLASSWLLAIIGLGGAAALWWFGTGVNPLH